MDERINDLDQRVCHLQTMLHSMCNRDEQTRSNNSFRCTYPGLTNEDLAWRYAESPLSFSDRNYGKMENTRNLEELECIDGDQKLKKSGNQTSNQMEEGECNDGNQKQK